MSVDLEGLSDLSKSDVDVSALDGLSDPQVPTSSSASAVDQASVHSGKICAVRSGFSNYSPASPGGLAQSTDGVLHELDDASVGGQQSVGHAPVQAARSDVSVDMDALEFISGVATPLAPGSVISSGSAPSYHRGQVPSGASSGNGHHDTPNIGDQLVHRNVDTANTDTGGQLVCQAAGTEATLARQRAREYADVLLWTQPMASIYSILRAPLRAALYICNVYTGG